MATYKRNYRGLAASSSEYARSLPGNGSGFRGVDFSSNAAFVSPARLAWCENMYRDYHSEQGGAIETIPGYRLHYNFGAQIFGAQIFGMWRYTDAANADHLAVHADDKVYLCDPKGITEPIACEGSVAAQPSLGFPYNGRFYLIDGANYYVITEKDGGFALTLVRDVAYMPTTHALGKEYMQYNMLSPYFKQLETVATTTEMPAASKDDFLPVGWDDWLQGYVTTIKYATPGDFVRLCPEPTEDGEYGEGNVASFKAKRVLIFENASIKNESSSTQGDVQTNDMLEAVVICNDGEKTGTVAENTFAACERLNQVFLSVTSENGKIAVEEQAFPTREMALYFNFPKGELDKHVTVPQNLPPNVWIKPDGAQSVSVVLDYDFSPDAYYPNSDMDALCECYLEDPDNDIQPVHYKPLEIFPRNGRLVVRWRYDHRGESNKFYLKIPYRTTDDVLDVLELVISTKDEDAACTYTYGLDVKPMIVTPYNMATEITKATLAGMSFPVGAYDGGFAVLMPTGDEPTEIVFEGLARSFGTVKGHPSFEAANDTFGGTAYEAITGCTIAAQFDDRIFLSGNPNLPNTVFYCGRNDSGITDPTYFGVLDYFNDGTGYDRVTGMLATGSHLMVAKENVVFYHQGADGDDIVPRIYPATRGSEGVGCVAPGSTCNFRDDPVFLSKFGLEGVSKETLTLERTLGHRSSMVDRKLLSEAAISCAASVEWDGWYCLFINGNVYMADSRALYQDATGNAQYEWFYLTGVGDHANDAPVYRSVSGAVTVDGAILTEGDYTIGNVNKQLPLVVADEDIFFCDADGDEDAGEVRRGYIYDADGEKVGHEAHFYGVRDGVAYLLEETEERRGGIFYAAEHPTTLGDRLFFAANGKIFVFNTDKRGQSVTAVYDDGSTEEEPVAPDRIHRRWYTFAGHRIKALAATALDDCDVPHLAKNTTKRSLVLRAKVMAASAFALSVMTDRTAAWGLVETRSNASESFYDDDFTNKTLLVANDAIYVGAEKEKRWVEKQFLLSDTGFMRPFGFYEMTYRYSIAGRIKG